MNLFTILEGEKAILSRKGRYYQVDLYKLGDRLFAKHGSAFIGLQSSKGTTDPGTLWHDISIEGKSDKLGRLLAP